MTIRPITIALCLLLGSIFAQAQSNYATPYTFTTFAGLPFLGAGNTGNVDATGTAAEFGVPCSMAIDSTGNAYVADGTTIRKITTGAVVTTFAGQYNTLGSADGTGTSARFYNPRGVAVDSTGNVYVADTNGTIRMITSGGVVTTLAGTADTTGSVDALGTAARFNGPQGVAVDAAGNVYVADTGNQTIRKITSVGVVTTFAGQAGLTGSADGTGTAARFNFPSGLAVDSSGNIYVADTQNNTIRKITPSGVVMTLAGQAGNPLVYADGTGSAALFSFPTEVAADAAGNLYVADSANSVVRKITPTAVVTTLAGYGYLWGNGSADGFGHDARFWFPKGVTVDATGQIFVCDTYNATIRKVTPAGMVTTWAGTRPSAGCADGTGSAARFQNPIGIAMDSAGNMYVGDSQNITIRKITPAGVVTTVAGQAETFHNEGADDGFALPDALGSVAVDSSGTIYATVPDLDIILKIVPNKTVSTFADLGDKMPLSVAVDITGSVYVGSFGRIYKITPTGVVSIFAGGGFQGSADGAGAAAQFSTPEGLAVDSTGNVYVADTENQVIRKITPGGIVTTIAGQVGSYGRTDGIGSAARFGDPCSIAVDAAGNLYIAEWGNNLIRMVTPNGVVTTLAGGNGYGYPDGTGSEVGFSAPQGVALDRMGNLYVADTNNNTIRKGTPPVAAPGFTLQPISQRVFAGNAVTFTTAASGTLSPTYQWQKNGVNIGGATNSSYTISHVGIGDAGSYTVTVTNTSGSIVSAAAVLSVPIVATDDFDGDGKSDVILTDTVTGERAIWLMNGTSINAGASLGIIPAEWIVSGIGDFDGDGEADILLTNTTTGERAVWLMNGTTIRSGVSLGIVPTTWAISKVGDFDGDGKSDIILTNTVTGERAIWLMNGAAISAGSSLGLLPIDWTISGTGDFDGDGKTDVILTNTTTGERAIWLMNGAMIGAGASLGIVPTSWGISGVGDFNGDGKSDMVLTNTVTGERAIWLMNGAMISAGASLGIVPADWEVSGVGDFDGDGKADIVLTNTTTGERAIWLMNGTVITAGSIPAIVPVEWLVQ